MPTMKLRRRLTPISRSARSIFHDAPKRRNLRLSNRMFLCNTIVYCVFETARQQRDRQSTGCDQRLETDNDRFETDTRHHSGAVSCLVFGAGNGPCRLSVVVASGFADILCFRTDEKPNKRLQFVEVPDDGHIDRRSQGVRRPQIQPDHPHGSLDEKVPHRRAASALEHPGR